MKKYEVFMKIFGNERIEVEANSEGDAIREAAASISFEHIEDWDVTKTGAEAELLEES